MRRFRLSFCALAISCSLGLAAACGGDEDTKSGGDGDGDGDGDGGNGDGDGDGDGDNGQGGTTNGIGGPCTSDKDCRAADGLCDLARSVCVECLTTFDCGDDQECSSGVCEGFTSCQSSKECNVDQVCDTSISRCVECVGDNDCSDGQACVSNKCATQCDSDKTCTPEDKVCALDLGVCVECARPADCAAGQYCSDSNTCVTRVCDAGDGSCDGNTLVICNAEGDGYDQVTCPDGCDSSGPTCEGAPGTGGNGTGGNGTGGSGNGGDCQPKVRLLIQRSGSMFELPALAENWWSAVSDALDSDGTDLLDQFATQMDLSVSTFHMVSTTETCPLLATQAGPVGANGLATFLSAQQEAHDEQSMAGKVDAPVPEAIGQAVAELGTTGDRYILLVVTGTPDSCSVQDSLCSVEPTLAALQGANANGIITKVLYLPSVDPPDPYAQSLANAGAGQEIEEEPYFTSCVGRPVVTYSDSAGSASYQSPANVSGVAASLSALFTEISACE